MSRGCWAIAAGGAVNPIELIAGLFTIVVVFGISANWLKIAYPILLVCGGFSL